MKYTVNCTAANTAALSAADRYPIRMPGWHGMPAWQGLLLPQCTVHWVVGGFPSGARPACTLTGECCCVQRQANCQWCCIAVSRLGHCCSIHCGHQQEGHEHLRSSSVVPVVSQWHCHALDVTILIYACRKAIPLLCKDVWWSSNKLKLASSVRLRLGQHQTV
jgi:hypothetical protein